MVIQEPLTKRLAYRSLIYAMLGDKTQSEALRATMDRLNHHKGSMGLNQKGEKCIKFQTSKFRIGLI